MRVTQRWRRWRQEGVRWWRGWSTVVIATVVSVLLALFGFIGAGRDQPLRGERFDRKQFVIEPATPNGVRVTEVVDVDFGRFKHHGYYRVIPADAGEPRDVSASSTANSDVVVGEVESDGQITDYEIRIGTASQQWRGHQRYTLSYTLPDARPRGGRLKLDVIGTNDSLVTDHVDIWLVGFDFKAVDCYQGGQASTERCPVSNVSEGYVARIDNLAARNGVTIDTRGTSELTITSSDGVVQPTLVGPIEGWPHWRNALIVLASALVTIMVLAAIRLLLGADRMTRPDPAKPDPARPAPLVATHTSPDGGPTGRSTVVATTHGLAKTAASESAPPDGVRPWQAAVLLNEAIDERSVRAWFAEMIALGAVRPVIANVGDRKELRGVSTGDRTAMEVLPEFDRDVVRAVTGIGSLVSSDERHEAMSEVWRRLTTQQEWFARSSKWWRRRPPRFRSSPLRHANWSLISFLLVIYLSIGWVVSKSWIGPVEPIVNFLASLSAAAALVAVWIVWTFSPRVIHAPSRSVLGSAVALRVLGFRKFLLNSKQGGVTAAPDRSRVGEYAAWAVATNALNVANAPSASSAARTKREQTLNASVAVVASSLDFDWSSSIYGGASLKSTRVNPWRSIGNLFRASARDAQASYRRSRRLSRRDSWWYASWDERARRNTARRNSSSIWDSSSGSSSSWFSSSDHSSEHSSDHSSDSGVGSGDGGGDSGFW